MESGKSGGVRGAVAAETFVHIDLHKDQLTWCALDREGHELGWGRLPTKCRQRIVTWVHGWKRPVWVSMETVGFYRWLWVLLEPEVDRLILADAARLRRMGRRDVKTDARDARHGARLLRLGELPESHALGEPRYSLRQLLRHRHDLARRLAGLKNSLRRLTLRANLPGPRSLNGARAIAYHDAYGSRLHPMDEARWVHLSDQVLLLERQLDQVERTLQHDLEAMPALYEDLSLLTTAPGIALLTAATVFTETGGLSRFDHPDPLGCFSGLTPRTFASADTVRQGRISKAGPPNLRWVLQQAAWVAIRTDPDVRRLHQRLSRRAGSKKAATAVARRLLIWLWAMHRTGRPWDPKRLRAALDNTTKKSARETQLAAAPTNQE